MGGAGGGALTLFHGTDAASAADIVNNGLDASSAAELGGGDVFWATTDRSAAEVFAEANPAGGDPALVSVTVPEAVMSSLSRQGLVSIEGAVHSFAVEAWDTPNEFATFTRLR